MTLNFLFLICSLLAGIYSFQCPNGFEQVPGENVCMITVNSSRTYNDVIQGCSAQNAIPVKITTIYENSFVFAMTQEIGDSSPYIGVEQTQNFTWVYADGSTLKYQNWAPGEPVMLTGWSCAIIDGQTGKWKAADCNSSRTSVCSIDYVHTCPAGWTYFAKTGLCYYPQDFVYLGSVWQLFNWTTAEATCQQMGSHLVSIHSKDEDNFVADLIETTNIVYLCVAGYKDPCYYERAWNGYFGNGTVGSASWSDGSPVDYHPDGQKDSVAIHYAMGNDPSCSGKQWTAAVETDRFARFVCKMPPKPP